MKHLAIALILSLSLVGCASNKAPVTADIPIPVACKTENPNKPTYHYAPPYDSVFDAVRDLLGDRKLSEAYQTELEAALKSCK
jgi:PBP1b-binding outer membrane lipoprotein LpoB